MKPGIEASAMIGALRLQYNVRAVLDFVNNIYNVDGTDYGIGQMISNPDRYSSEEGLAIGFETAWKYAPAIINPALLDFLNLCSFSVVADVELFTEGQGYQASAAVLALEEWYSGCCMVLEYYSDADIYEYAEDNRYVGSQSLTAGRHLMAATRTNDKLRVVADNVGFSEWSKDDTYNMMPDPTTESYLLMTDEENELVPFSWFNSVHIGGWIMDRYNGDGQTNAPIVVKSLMFLDPVRDAFLARLPALPPIMPEPYEPPPFDPPLEDTVLDFLNRRYYTGGSLYTATQVIDKPHCVGFNGQHWEGSGDCLLLGDFKTLMETFDWTIFYEFLMAHPPSSPQLLGIYNAGNSRYFYLTPTQIGDYDGTFRVANDSGWTSTQGIHRVAATRTNSKLSMSIDGRSVVTNTDSKTLPVGGDVYTHKLIKGVHALRKLQIYDTPLDDSALPGMSALT